MSEIYKYPEYYAIGMNRNTATECNFIETCLETYGPEGSKHLLDIGCGSGRHLMELARRGYEVVGIDNSPEMIEYVREKAEETDSPITAIEDDVRNLSVDGSFALAYCFLDTFRTLLANEEITNHLVSVSNHLIAGGIYLIDFWLPRHWDQIGNEVHQWEESSGETTVKVFYLQHPESIDPVNQTFEDELVFEVKEDGEEKTIKGGRTRTRLILPQEFNFAIKQSEVFEIVGTFSDMALTKPLQSESMSWRMVSVLKKL